MSGVESVGGEGGGWDLNILIDIPAVNLKLRDDESTCISQVGRKILQSIHFCDYE